MSNPIEVPENIIALAKKILEDSNCYGDNSLELANYITSATRPEIEVEPFVLYRVQVQGDASYRIGFRVSQGATFSWVTLAISTPEKEDAYPVSVHSLGIHKDEEIEVLERWTPEPKFGIGDPGEVILSGREVLVKGIVSAETVDSDGDVRVEMRFAGGINASTAWVTAKDIAYTEEA